MIDWVVVLAQVANFLILVFVLKYFFYGRVIAAMDERERKITERWDQAAKEREEAVSRQVEYQEKTDELEKQRERWIVETKKEVEEFRVRLMRQIREDMDRLKSRWQQTLAAEKEGFLRDLRNKLGEGVCHLASRALAELANADLEDSIVRLFLTKLQQKQTDDIQHLAIDENGTASPVTIHSAFPISAPVQQTIRETLRGVLHQKANVEFETVPDLICGIELTGNGHKIAWEIGHYVDNLEEQLTNLLDEEVDSSPGHGDVATDLVGEQQGK